MGKVKKRLGGADCISLNFGAIMGIMVGQTRPPVETRSVKIPKHNNKTIIMRIQLFTKKKENVISDDFNEQVIITIIITVIITPTIN
jgi:hypothetical protein